MKKKMLYVAATALLASGVGYAVHAADMTEKFKATLSSADEVPANDSKGKGEGEFTINPSTKELTWKVSYEGLTGDALAAHIHGPAEKGKNAGVEVNLGAGGMKNPLEGKATLTDQQISDITGGKTYVNVHTAAHKGGEIRGQIMK
jgi:Cu/Zn superoxide dismutase